MKGTMTTPVLSPKILLVENDPAAADKIRAALSAAGSGSFDVIWVRQLSEALARLTRKGIGAILLELSLPDSQGMETFDKLSFTALYTTFGAVTTDTTKTVTTTGATNAITPWRPEITRKLDNGSATVTVLAVGPGTPNFGSALGIRMTVTVSWTELGRAQTVSLSTMRF